MAYADIIRSDTFTADDVADKIDGLIPAIQNGTYTYGGVSTGSANIHAISTGQAPSAYANGQIFSFRAGYTNTGATTLNVHSLGAVVVQDNDTRAALVGGEIVAGSHYFVQYYSAVFYLLNPTSGAWTSYTTTHAGFSVNPTYTMFYKKTGRTVNLSYNVSVNGTSNATNYTVTIPFTAATRAGHVWSDSINYAFNNGVATTGLVTINSAGALANLYNTNSLTWTGSGAKGASFSLTYEAAS